MTLKEIIKLCDAYQGALKAEEILGNITNMIGYRSEITLIQPIKSAIFETFCFDEDKVDEQIYNALNKNNPIELYKLLNKKN